jgi:hypothetical protein
MTAATSDAGRATTPWHLWVVGLVSLLWNAYGGYDYTMSQLQGDAYYRSSGMTDAQIAYFHSYPTWMIADWAVGVWASVVGSILLLARSRFALHAFLLSLAAVIVSLVYAYVLKPQPDVMTGMTPIMQGVITVACALFAYYSWTMTKRGVLR